MTRRLLTGNAAAAWGARLARVDYVPAFPITPQTEIIETLAAWLDAGGMPGRMVTLESEHSMITAAGAAAATGVRVFTATSSQGLLYGMEMVYTVAGWRAPFVMINVSRGLAAPLTLESDHNDIMAARDSGFLQIHCASCQEITDSVLMAYRLAELYQGILSVITAHTPREAAVEETFVNENPRSTLKLGQARGTALLAPAMRGLRVCEYTPNQIKKTVVGAGHAEKRQIQAMIGFLLPKAKFASADEADALAIAICHASHRKSAELKARVMARLG